MPCNDDVHAVDAHSRFAHWLGKFVLQVRMKKDASEYPPKTLYRNGMLLQKIRTRSIL